MSETAPPATNASRIAEWGPLATTAIFGAAFLAAVIWAYIAKDDQSKTLLIGAVISNATTAVQFWLGSSAGGQKKDATIAAIATGAPPPVPAPPATPPTEGPKP